MSGSWFGRARSDDDSKQPAAAPATRAPTIEDAIAVAGVGYWRQSKDGDALQTNEALHRLYDKAFPKTIFLDRLFEVLFGAEAPDELKDAWRDAMLGKSDFDRVHQIERLDGRTLWVRSVISVRRDDEGAISGATGLAIDIDAHKQRELDLDLDVKRIEETHKFTSEVLDDVCHELRAPLKQLTDATRSLSEGDAEAIAAVDIAGRRITAALAYVADLQKIRAGEIAPNSASFDIVPLLEEIVANQAAAAEAKGLTLSGVIADGAATKACSDRERFAQILNDVVAAAVRDANGDAVSLEAKPAQNGRVRIEVAYNGIGPKNGHGVRRKLMEALGGSLKLHATSGAGSAYLLELPTEHQKTEATAIQPDAPEQTGGEQRCRILIAEDDPVNQEVFLEALAPGGYQIDIAENGLVALNMLRKADYDLVLMDINMPKMNGEEAIAQIRAADAPFRDIPVIVVTALNGRESSSYFRGIGATDYIQKPIDIDRLQKRVEMVIGAHRTG